MDVLPNEDDSLGNSSAKWNVNGHNLDYIELTIQLQSANGQTIVINDSRITNKHVVLNSIASDLVGYRYVPV